LPFQPLIALCRPNPESKWRPVFNWIHWFFGLVAMVLASEWKRHKISNGECYHGYLFSAYIVHWSESAQGFRPVVGHLGLGGFPAFSSHH
jgi:hypothetical protein